MLQLIGKKQRIDLDNRNGLFVKNSLKLKIHRSFFLKFRKYIKYIGIENEISNMLFLHNSS